MAAFAIYILLDYLSHERNVYKLLFLLPIGMSTAFFDGPAEFIGHRRL